MRKFLVVFLLLALFNSADAQKFSFGLKFNPHFSWFKINNKDSIKNDGIGFMFSYGLTSDYNFTENYSLNIEIMQTFFNASTSRFSYIQKYKLQNIEVPIALKMKTNYINNFKYFCRIGFSPSITTSAKVTNRLNNDTEKTGLFNFGLIIGAGLHYKLADRTFALAGVTLHNYFLPVNKNQDSYIVKPIFISIDLGVLF